MGQAYGPPPSLLDRHWKHGLILAATAAFALIGLTILAEVERWFGG